MKRNENKKSNNKGFTLVELIVVLVILAILAAILVPALLGYIDRAKEEQVILNGRSCYTAAQAELSSMYGTNITPDATNMASTGKNGKRILETADVPNCSSLVIGVKGASGHDAYTVGYVKYAETVGGNTTTIYFDGKEWTTTAEAPTNSFTIK